MLANIAIGAVIFGYASWTIFRHVKKSKKESVQPVHLRITVIKNVSDVKGYLVG